MEFQGHQVGDSTAGIEEHAEDGSGPHVLPQFHFPKQAAHLERSRPLGANGCRFNSFTCFTGFAGTWPRSANHWKKPRRVTNARLTVLTACRDLGVDDP